MLIRTLAIVVGIAAGCCTQAIAGGDGWDGPIDIDGAGPVIYGFVRDPRGSTIPDAVVTLKPKKGEPVALKSNVMGLYRGHAGKGVLVDDVEVSCIKPGYKQIKVFRRSPPGTQGMIQTECILQRL